MKSISIYIAAFIAILMSMTISCFANGDASESPEIKIEYKVILPEKMQKALGKFDPEFKVYEQSDFSDYDVKDDYDFSSKQTPATVIGDFNGDGIKDIALFGRNKKNSLILCILSNGGDFRVYDVENLPVEPGLFVVGSDDKKIGLNLFLVYWPPGHNEETHWEETSLDLTSDSILVVQSEASAHIVYFKNGAFHEYWISD